MDDDKDKQKNQKISEVKNDDDNEEKDNIGKWSHPENKSDCEDPGEKWQKVEREKPEPKKQDNISSNETSSNHTPSCYSTMNQRRTAASEQINFGTLDTTGVSSPDNNAFQHVPDSKTMRSECENPSQVSQCSQDMQHRSKNPELDSATNSTRSTSKQEQKGISNARNPSQRRSQFGPRKQGKRRVVGANFSR